MDKILILAPHADDGEFGCGGSIKRWTMEGARVWYAAFSPCIKSLPEGFEGDILYRELDDAATCLGIDQDAIIKFRYPVREFPAHRQAILDDLIQLRKTIDPELVLCPNRNDIHQDHRQICHEACRAFKGVRLLGYELPWNNRTAVTNFHVRLTQEHMEAKWKAVQVYRSQAARHYTNKDLIFGLGVVRGYQVKSEYAEAFEAIYWQI